MRSISHHYPSVFCSLRRKSDLYLVPSYQILQAIALKDTYALQKCVVYTTLNPDIQFFLYITKPWICIRFLLCSRILSIPTLFEIAFYHKEIHHLSALPSTFYHPTRSLFKRYVEIHMHWNVSSLQYLLKVPGESDYIPIAAVEGY